jgi:hypothetical protein
VLRATIAGSVFGSGRHRLLDVGRRAAGGGRLLLRGAAGVVQPRTTRMTGLHPHWLLIVEEATHPRTRSLRPVVLLVVFLRRVHPEASGRVIPGYRVFGFLDVS